MHAQILRVAMLAAAAGANWQCQSMASLTVMFNGWIRLAVEGHGETLMRPGGAMCVPVGMRHNVSDYSENYSLLQVATPADFAIVSTSAPM